MDTFSMGIHEDLLDARTLWSVLIRLYGPLEPWFDKTWKPGDFELVE
jgi:hypothetical protein